jgi:hypothetical protein
MCVKRKGVLRGLTVTSFQIGDETVHVGLLGGTSVARRAEISRVSAATRRILGD